MRTLIERSFTGMGTFADLAQFRKRHQKEIDRLVQFYRSEQDGLISGDRACGHGEKAEYTTGGEG